MGTSGKKTAGKNTGRRGGLKSENTAVKAINVEKLTAHPLADLLPLMSDAELGALMDDIAKCGRLREPIVLHEGKILDGRNRWRCCLKLNKPQWITTRTFDPKAEGAPLSYVYSKAVHRNMTDSQKAAAAVMIEAEFAKDGAARMKAGVATGVAGGVAPVPQGQPVGQPGQPKLISGRTRAQMAADLKQNGNGRGIELKRQWLFHVKGIQPVQQKIEEAADDWGFPGLVESVKQILDRMYGPEAPAQPAATGKSRDLAGALFGVSGRYVQDAKKLFESDKKLFRQVFDGQLPITRAKRLMIREHKTRETQQKIATIQATQAKCSMAGDHWKIATGDCLQQLKLIPAKSVRLVFADPPYNLGFKYDADPTRDKLPDEQYLKWCLDWMSEAHRVLAPDGTLAVLHCEEYQAEIGVLLKRAGFVVRRLIVWYETFGENCSRNFNRTCRFLYYAVKDARTCVFNEEAFLTESARAAVYGDKRAMPGGKILDALWQISRLQGTSSERVADLSDAPTQLPLALLERIVKGFCDPGDLVVDPFCGTGSTGHAALLNHRRFLGIERSPKYSSAARARLTIAAHELRKSQAAAKGSSKKSA